MRQSISKRKSRECFCQGNWAMGPETGLNTPAKDYFYQPTLSMPIWCWVLIFACEHVWPAVPNQTEVYIVQISHLSALKTDKRNRVDFDSWKFPKWHSAFTFLHQRSWDTSAHPSMWLKLPEHDALSDQDVGCPLHYVDYKLSSVEKLMNPPCRKALKGLGPSFSATAFQR